jgi:hypothetical protein
MPFPQKPIEPPKPSQKQERLSASGFHNITLSGFDEGTQGAEERPAVGKRVRDGSGYSSVHLSVSQNPVGCHAVRLNVRRGAPTIQASIIGSLKTSL